MKKSPRRGRAASSSSSSEPSRSNATASKDSKSQKSTHGKRPIRNGRSLFEALGVSGARKGLTLKTSYSARGLTPGKPVITSTADLNQPIRKSSQQSTPGSLARASEAARSYEGPSRSPRLPKAQSKDNPRNNKALRGQKGQAPLVEGMVKRHPDGFGFLIPDDRTIPDVYISRQYMTGVMTNDRVLAEVYRHKNDERYFGEIKKLVKRANSLVVGRFLPVDQKYGVIQDDGRGWGMDLRISTPFSMNAKDGDLVAVEILTYPQRDSEFTGKVVSIIGDLEDPMNDVKRVIFSNHIPHEFSLKTKSEAQAFGNRVKDHEVQGRVDLRKKNLITIDGATARDFDDAICTESDGHGGYRVWVAIADVSHYVRPRTQLDQEAFERGTSTYFPNFVVPMLPEELSNELCSLNPKVPRLCFVCEMKLDSQGVIRAYEFYEGVMESKARVTYGEAQEVLDGHTPDRLHQVAENIKISAELARILMSKRYREGSLDLDVPETQVVVDSSGQTTDILRSERLFAHRLIEELMLVTNICCARFMEERHIPGVFRIHEAPNPDNMEMLQKFIWNFGGSGVMSGANLQAKIGKALAHFAGKPEAQVLNILTLRSMNQAKYSAENLGHFGLGFSQYSHFTSPIRRYPDLIAHRLIKSVLYPKYRSQRMTESELATSCTMLSACEQRSVKAERQLISIKKARFMQKFIGQEFVGIISSVAKFGCFVLLRAYDVDGLLKIEELGNDRFIFDPDSLSLTGQHTKKRWAIGTPVSVVVRAVDPEMGKIDFVLAGTDLEEKAESRMSNGGSEIEQSSPSKRNRNRDQKRKPSDDDRSNVRKARFSKRRRKD